MNLKQTVTFGLWLGPPWGQAKTDWMDGPHVTRDPSVFARPVI